jgi:hypothetical protein
MVENCGWLLSLLEETAERNRFKMEMKLRCTYSSGKLSMKVRI